MCKAMTQQDSCYTPKYFVDMFGSFDYDPATTKEQAEYLNKIRGDLHVYNICNFRHFVIHMVCMCMCK